MNFQAAVEEEVSGVRATTGAAEEEEEEEVAAGCDTWTITIADRGL